MSSEIQILLLTITGFLTVSVIFTILHYSRRRWKLFACNFPAYASMSASPGQQQITKLTCRSDSIEFLPPTKASHVMLAMDPACRSSLITTSSLPSIPEMTNKDQAPFADCDESTTVAYDMAGSSPRLHSDSSTYHTYHHNHQHTHTLPPRLPPGNGGRKRAVCVPNDQIALSLERRSSSVCGLTPGTHTRSTSGLLSDADLEQLLAASSVELKLDRDMAVAIALEQVEESCISFNAEDSSAEVFGGSLRSLPEQAMRIDFGEEASSMISSPDAKSGRESNSGTSSGSQFLGRDSVSESPFRVIYKERSFV